MFIRPYNYQVGKEGKLLIYGYDEQGNSICAKTITNEKVILKFQSNITKEIIEDINTLLQPKSIKQSNFVPNVLIIEDPLIDNDEEDDGEENRDPWSDAISNPYGDFNSYFSTIKIRPYDWCFISAPRLKNSLDRETNCNIEFEFDNTNLSNLRPTMVGKISKKKKFYWDIETFSPDFIQFPSATNPSNQVRMISIVINNGEGEVYGYLLAFGQIEPFQAQIPFTIFSFDNEKELLEKFFQIWLEEMPDYSITFNGDAYDAPYIKERVKLLGIKIPNIGKNKGLKSNYKSKIVITPFGTAPGAVLNTPGIENIDLLSVFRRIYPGLPNYHLDTIAKIVLNEGKTGLEIGTMMKYMASGDPILMAQVGKYSLQDSILLNDLVETLDIIGIMETISNITKLMFSEIFDQSPKYVINAMAFSIDPGLIYFKTKQNNREDSNHLVNITPGIYSDVSRYDYNKIYLKALQESPSNELAYYFAETLLEKNNNPPSFLITTIYFSDFITKDTDSILNFYLSNLIAKYPIIGITNNLLLIKNTPPQFISEPDLIHIDEVKTYVAIDKNNTIFKYNNEIDLVFSGLNKICKPAFSYIKRYTQNYIAQLTDNIITSEDNTPNIEEFYMSVKLKGDTNYKRSEDFRAKLLAQYKKPISTWIKVKWIMTTKGPLLTDNIIPGTQIMLDMNYYNKKLGDVNEILTKLIYFG